MKNEEIGHTSNPSKPKNYGAVKTLNEKIHRILYSIIKTKKRKYILSVLLLTIMSVALALFPPTRYAIAGNFIKKDFAVSITDLDTKAPVSEAQVLIDGKSLLTDKDGKVEIHGTPVGDHSISVKKKYYSDITKYYRIPIFSDYKILGITIEATGRQVAVSVKNKIGGNPLAKAKISVSDTSAVSDENGKTTIVLPPNNLVLKAKISAEGFNDKDIEFKVENKDTQLVNIDMTPTGTLYFLSKRTGKIDILKSNLDGTDIKTVLRGTGEEDAYSTSLIASRDWRNLALLSRRDSDKAKLYDVDSSNGSLKVIDDENADFQIIGWNDNKLYYLVNRVKGDYWENKKQAIKSYDPLSGKSLTLDETNGEGADIYQHKYETISNLFILENELVYNKDWNYGYSFNYIPTDKKMTFMSINLSNEKQTILKQFDDNFSSYFDTRLTKPSTVIFKVITSDKTQYFEYDSTKVETLSNMNEIKFNNVQYTTYLESPSGKLNLWYEPRDGKSVVFIGDNKAGNQKELSTQSDFIPYGWYGDDYVLLSKLGSELYIASARELNNINEPFKVTDYNRPGLPYRDYGYGYGGQ